MDINIHVVFRTSEGKKYILFAVYEHELVFRFVICCHSWFHKLTNIQCVVEHAKCMSDILYITVYLVTVGFCQRFLFKRIHFIMQHQLHIILKLNF